LQGAFEVFDYPGGYLDTGAGNPIATRRLEELQAGRSRAAGRSNARGLLVGSLLSLEKHPVAAQNAEYLVLSSTGSVRGNALESVFEGGGQEEVYTCTFECYHTDLTPYRPPRRTPRPIIHGTQTAIVRGGEGSEIYTDEYGRVRVEFHWDRKSPGNQDSSCWVRVAQIWAGSGFGAVFIPRLGQEVLVDFLEGDPDRPIVVGSVYNSEHKPPYLPLDATQSGIKTRSSLGGGEDNFNEIKFEDKKGEEQLFFQAEKDHTINVKNNRSASVGAADSVSVGASRSVSVTKDLSTSVGTGGAAKCNLAVTGIYDVKVSDTIEIEAKTHIQLKVGDSIVKITPTMIELTSGGKAVLRLDTNAYAQSSLGSTVLLDKNACMTASESGAQLLLDANALMTSKDGGSLFLDADASMDSGSGSAFVSGAKAVSLAGATNATINLEAAGATVSGPKVDMAATATAQVTGPVVKIN
jgi:type VI secretion system secreted protein VgrG